MISCSCFCCSQLIEILHFHYTKNIYYYQQISCLQTKRVLLSDHVNLEQNAKENAVNCLIIGNVVMFEVLFDSFPEYE